MAPHSSTLGWKNPMDGGAWWAAVHGVAKSRTWLSDFIFTFYFHALEKEMVTHCSVLAWGIPGTGEPGGLPFMGSHRVGHDWSDLAAAAAAARLIKKRTEIKETKYVIFKRVDILSLNNIPKNINRSMSNFSCSWWGKGGGEGDSLSKLQGVSVSQGYLLEKAMAPHSSTPAWKIPWTEEPGRLQSMRSLRVGRNRATSLSLFTFMHWRRKW